jgi:periplasmic divalent cation tolerance protein
MKNNYLIILCTVPDRKTAQTISNKLVEDKKAACCNIVPAITSVYFWENQLQQEEEQLLIIKTRAEHYDSLQKRVMELHPYTVPEIIAIPIIHGNPEYLNWVDENVE